MAGGGVRSGKAYVDFTIRDRVGRDLRKIERNLNNFARSATLAGAAITGAGVALASVFSEAVKEFSRTEQLLGRFKAVFGELADEADSFAVSLSDSIGQSALTIRDTLTRFQALLQGGGNTPEVSLAISKALTQATEDILAFDDTIANIDEAQRRVVSGLVGETEAIRRTIGADIRVSQVDKELARLGFEGAAKSADEASRRIARFNIIIRALKSSGAAGQAAREIRTLATGFRVFSAELRELRSAVGEGVAQFFAPLLDAINQSVKAFRIWSSQNKEVFAGLAVGTAVLTGFGVTLIGLGVAATTLGAVLAGLQVIIGSVAAVAAALGGAATALPLAIGLGAAAVVTAIVAYKNWNLIVEQTISQIQNLGRALKNQVGIFGNTFSGVADALRLEDAERAWDIALLGFRASWAQMWDDLVDISLANILKIGIRSKGALAQFIVGDYKPEELTDPVRRSLNQGLRDIVGSVFGDNALDPEQVEKDVAGIDKILGAALGIQGLGPKTLTELLERKAGELREEAEADRQKAVDQLNELGLPTRDAGGLAFSVANAAGLGANALASLGLFGSGARGASGAVGGALQQVFGTTALGKASSNIGQAFRDVSSFVGQEIFRRSTIAELEKSLQGGSVIASRTANAGFQNFEKQFDPVVNELTEANDWLAKISTRLNELGTERLVFR